MCLAVGSVACGGVGAFPEDRKYLRGNRPSSQLHGALCCEAEMISLPGLLGYIIINKFLLNIFY